MTTSQTNPSTHRLVSSDSALLRFLDCPDITAIERRIDLLNKLYWLRQLYPLETQRESAAMIAAGREGVASERS